MAKIKVTKDGASNVIVGSLEFAKEAYPDSTYEEILPAQLSEQAIKETNEEEAREWRNSELARTDTLSLLTDHPDYSKMAGYRKALRDWPSTSDFPDTKPSM